MSSLDQYVGFSATPEGLEEFLDQEGYEMETRKEDYTLWHHKEFGWPNIYYHPKATQAEEDEVPDWSQAGRPITADLLVMTQEYDQYEIVNELVKKLVKQYDSVWYDPGLDQFFTKTDI